MTDVNPELFPGYNTGPFIQAASFVETVITGNDGTLSMIRMIDRIAVVVQGNEAPAELPEDGNLHLKLVVCLKPGETLGRHQLKLRPELPSGRRLDTQTIDVFFEGPDRGVNVIMDMTLPAEEGPYHVDVLFGENNRQLTRMPFRVMYQRVPS